MADCAGQRQCPEARLVSLSTGRCGPLDMGCHLPKATQPSPLSMFETRASPRRAWVCILAAWVCLFLRTRSPSGAQPAPQLSPLSGVSSDLKPSPARLASSCGSGTPPLLHLPLSLPGDREPSGDNEAPPPVMEMWPQVPRPLSTRWRGIRVTGRIPYGSGPRAPWLKRPLASGYREAQGEVTLLRVNRW